MSSVASTAPATDGPTYSIVVPVFNEIHLIQPFLEETRMAIDRIEGARALEVLMIDDGSNDGTWQRILDLQRSFPLVRGLRLTRNFGKESALAAGLEHARGDAVIVMDVDLQDPPAIICDFVRFWLEGYDIVYGKRIKREGDGWLRGKLTRIFYGILGKIGDIPIPSDVGDFRLMNRKAIDAFNRLQERSRYSKGLFAWLGFRSREVLFERPERRAGQTKWSMFKLVRLAGEGITSFSTVPLSLALWVGLLTGLYSFVYGAWIIFKTLYWGEVVRGYPTLMTVVLFLGGLQLTFLGVVGQYIGRIYAEVKRRPIYLILDESQPAGANAPSTQEPAAAQAPASER